MTDATLGWDMEKTTLDKVKLGSVFAKDVYAIDGKLLVKKGTTYREPFVDRFREYGVREVFIEPPVEKEALPAARPVIHTAFRLSDVIHDRTRTHANGQMKRTLSKLTSVSNQEIRRIRKIVEAMVEELLEKKDFVLALTQMRSVDDYTYQHSVNVGVLSLMIGIDLGLTREELLNLGTGAMLHDIGKIMVPETIIKKPAKLTGEEYEEVKRHTDYGYAMLQQTDITEEAAQIALCHHERYDGTGYGQGLRASGIPLYSRIVAVADVYDAMSNDRVYQKKVPHERVYREITHLGGIHFDQGIMETFARHLHIYPTGSGVILNGNRRGIVMEQNRLYPESPVVRVFTPEHKDPRRLHYDLDLSLGSHDYIIDTF